MDKYIFEQVINIAFCYWLCMYPVRHLRTPEKSYKELSYINYCVSRSKAIVSQYFPCIFATCHTLNTIHLSFTEKMSMLFSIFRSYYLTITIHKFFGLLHFFFSSPDKGSCELLSPLSVRRLSSVRPSVR